MTWVPILLCHLLAVTPWASCFSSLCPTSSIFETGTIIIMVMLTPPRGVMLRINKPTSSTYRLLRHSGQVSQVQCSDGPGPVGDEPVRAEESLPRESTHGSLSLGGSPKSLQRFSARSAFSDFPSVALFPLDPAGTFLPSPPSCDVPSAHPLRCLWQRKGWTDGRGRAWSASLLCDLGQVFCASVSSPAQQE